MSDIAQRLARLSPEQRAALLRKASMEQAPEEDKEGSVRSSGGLTQIVPQTREMNTAVLSFAQERLWFLHQLEPQSVAYTIPAALRLQGQISVSALVQSLEILVQRHEILRTTFSEQDGKPVQVIAPIPIGEGLSIGELVSPMSTQIPVVDLRACPMDRQEQLVDEITQQEISRPFDLATGPLFRLHLFRLRDQNHILLFTVHHIIFDGWSLHVFVRELTTLYEAWVKALPPVGQAHRLPLQYANYAQWQRQWLQGDVLQEQLDYWRQQLAGAPAVLNMPTDHPRRLVHMGEGARRSLLLPLEMQQKLKDLSRQQNVTLFITLLAAFQVLLMRYSGQEDIVVGTPVANRTREELEGLIGFFVNMLPLRIDMRGNPSFLELLTRVRKVMQQSTRHQDLPFEKLVDALQVERSLSYTPLFQVAFILQNVPQTELKVAGLTFQTVEFERTTTKFDLTLELRESPQGLHSVIEYDSTLFDASTVERLLQHWMILLEGILADPQRPLSDLPVLTQAELELVAYGKSQGITPKTSQGVYLHQFFERQVEQVPDAIAVVFEDTLLTYQELNVQANRLAHRLGRLGIEPDRLVGIYMERSLELVIALLAVLKAGGAYVPLDPSYPASRLALLLEEIQPILVLTQTHLVSSLPSPWGHYRSNKPLRNGGPSVGIGGVERGEGGIGDRSHTPIGYTLCLDTSWHRLDQELCTNPVNVVEPSNLAYIIYTSGSTGRPKGVMITHQGLSNYLDWSRQYYQVERGCGSTMHSSLSFDLTITSLFLPLVSGRTVILIPEGQGIEGLVTVIRRNPHLSFLKLTPAHLELLNQMLSPEELQDVAQALVIGGEALAASTMAVWRECAQEIRLVNEYGPTETVVGCSIYEVSTNDQASGMVPIGYPIANTQLYILDTQCNPVPIGVKGELFIGGQGVARGYKNRPDLTAERFIPHPFVGIMPCTCSGPCICPHPGERLYRSGDLARYLPDGTIEFLGRMDEQVKLRGYRIELGEIEATLRAHPAVQDTVVVLREENKTRKVLVAYVVARAQGMTKGSAQGLLPTAPALQEYLLEHLPDYMVPPSIVLLETMPLTPNGKVDRKALPAPTAAGKHKPTYMAPRSKVEHTLATIWQQVLGLEQVGIHDNFFALGGDSILSLQVVSRARQAGLALTPRQIFQYQTLSQLAAVAKSQTGSLGMQEIVEGPVPLTPIQHWFFQRKLPLWQHFNQAVLLQVPANWDQLLLGQAFSAVFQQHDAFRLRYEATETFWRQRLVPLQQAPTLERIDLSEQEDQAAALKAYTNQIQASLDPQHGPILRAVLFDLGETQPARLLIVIHHLMIDGVSWRVLLEDIQTVIGQLRRGEMVHLPDKTTSFPHWAHYLYRLTHSALLLAEQNYWLALAQAPVVPLPLDRLVAGNGIQAHECRIERSLLPEETHLLLHEAGRPYHTHIEELLLVALLEVLARWIGTRQVRLDLEGHGREVLDEEGFDVSRTVGWFTTIYPVLFTLPAGDNKEDWIKAIKEQMRAVPNKGIGYGLLRYLGSDEDVATRLQSMPPSQISFNYLGQFDQGLTLMPVAQGGVRLAPERSGEDIAPENPRSHLLTVSSMVVERQLQLWLTYNEQVHQRTTIENIADEWLQNLRALLAHCLHSSALGYTPSDFPLARLDQATLDKVIASGRGSTPSGHTKVPVSGIEDLYPLTSLQHGMLFHTLYAPQSGTYVEQMLCRLHGMLDQVALEQAWHIVIAQHPVLRTSFVWQGLDSPLQIVWEQVDLPVQRLDWSDRSPLQQQTDLEAFLQTDRREGFALEQAPLMRLTVIRLTAPTDASWYQLIWSSHHILLDGWSTAIILQELFVCYSAYIHSEQPLLEHRRPYRDYLAWLQQLDMHQAQAYWQEALAGIQAATPLGIDRKGYARAAEPRYAEEVLQVSAETTARWRAFAKREQLTLNTLMQGAWALILSCYSGESDVLFGNVIAGRPTELARAERMVGMFINTLPARVRLPREETVGSFLKQLQEQQAEMRQYAYCSLVQVQGWCNVPRDLPLFESLLVFENYPVEAAPIEQLSNLQIDAVQVREQTNYPLTIVISSADALRLRVSYERDRFAPDAIVRLLHHLHTVLEQMITHPDWQLGELTLLTQAERNQLLLEWNATQTGETVGTRRDSGRIGLAPVRPLSACSLWEPLQDLCLHQLFEQQVERTPDAIAVVFEERCLSYGQLNRQANQLAHYLRGAGIGPESLVGLSIERSLEMIIALLGILKAGGAYVPLDPSYPQERLTFMLEDCHPALVLTQGTGRSSKQARDQSASPGSEQIPPLPTLIVDLNQVWDALSHEPVITPPCEVTPDHLAYLIYTSGSTGKPKGAMNSHRGICNRLWWMQQSYDLSAFDRVVQKTPFSFDVSVWEFFWPLITGACMIVASPGGHRDSAYLQSLMKEQAVTTVHFVPSLLRALLAEADLQSCGSLRQVICSGEALDARLCTRFFALAGDGVQLHNLYGPTEAAIDVTFWPCQREQFQGDLLSNHRDQHDGYGVPIGHPISNTQIYLLDRNLQPVPIGVTGELYIGGVALARGYVNRPDLTAERFIAHPFGNGERLYRTGDLARYRADGTIEYLGRTDHQIKLRGYRIELGEIESVLRAHPAVDKAIVLAHPGQTGEKQLAPTASRLVAYIVPYCVGTGDHKGYDGVNPSSTLRHVDVPEDSKSRGVDEGLAPSRPLRSRGQVTGSDLWKYLQTKLPDYMVPSHFVMLDTLPLSPNGKLDRRALLASTDLSSEHTGGLLFVGPRTQLEELLAQIWMRVLGVTSVGIHDNFFELGGHSLLATQVLSHIQQAVNRELPLRALFEAPTIAELAQQIEISIRGEQGLARDQLYSAATAMPALIRRDRASCRSYALSFAQERLWFLQQLEPHSSFYSMPFVLHPVGSLSLQALEYSLAALVQRHEVLRTTFPVLRDQPVQVIAPRLAIRSGAVGTRTGAVGIVPCADPVPTTLVYDPTVIDLSGLDKAEQERQAHILVQEEEQHPFDLAVGPLLRFHILRLGMQDHVMVFVMHHIISDGWSMSILTRELAVLYQAYVGADRAGSCPVSCTDPEGPPSPLPDLPIQYRDYALWQRQWLEGELLQKQLDYWRRRLEGAPTVLNLPSDRPRPAVQDYVGSKQMVLLPPELYGALVALSQREGTTLFMTLLAAYQVLLMRYTGQSDILVGVPIANRRHVELEHLIGFFVNTLIMRTDLGGDPSFRQLLARVREVALEGFAHQDLPFERLVSELQVERSLSYTPIFQVAFVLQNMPQAELNIAGISWQAVEFEHTTTKFDLTLELRERSDGWYSLVEYDSTLFNASTIECLLRHWVTLLEGIIADPECSLADLPLLTEAERTQILAQGTGSTTWNTTINTSIPDLCLHQLVEQQVERAADSVALAFGEDEQLTYQELNAQANHIAYRLQGIGIGPDRLVGVCMEPSLDLVIALLAVLKAGGAYVPLDPAFPQERLAFLLADTQVPVVLTQSHLLDLMGQAHKLLPNVELIRFEPHSCLHSTGQQRDNPASPVGPENLAYLIYTSGSTGQPKGVQVTHANVTRLFQATADHFRFQPGDAWTFFHSFAFDFSVWEIWGALHSGGRLVVVPYWLSRSPNLFWQDLLREQVTILSQTPSAFRQLIQVQDGQHSCLRTVVFGGEALELSSLVPWVQCYGDEAPQLINMYGITETTVHVTYRRLHEEEIRAGAGSLIGQPLSDLHLFVLDKHLQLVPIGVPGEVYVAGAGLARGYLNRPDLTAERFVPHPFSSAAGARLYRTGDLARYRETGELEYLGRVDRQVKLRGYRIELGEIEAVLRQHEAIQNCVVMFREDVAGDQRLVAYIVPVQESNPEATTQQMTEIHSSAQGERIAQWQVLYDELYRTGQSGPDPTFNIFGWNSSYTGQPLPAEDMHEQIDQAVERILARQPVRVLEIGCGTGLLLFRLAPHCTEYVASDFSREALSYVQHVLAQGIVPINGHISLKQQNAHETLQVPPETFDAIILNSVVQYFPDVQYFMQIIAAALEALKPGGFLFLGDLRNLALHQVYCTSVELYRAPGSRLRQEIQLAVRQRMQEEEELLIDPALFSALQRELPQVGQVQILLKRGSTHNELTRFRYDVVLCKEATEEREDAPVVWDWQQGNVTLDLISGYLREGSPQVLQIRRVPNKRLTRELQQVAWAFGDQGPETVREFRDELEHQALRDPDPEEFWALGEQLDYGVRVSWSAEGHGGFCDVLFTVGTGVSLPNPRSSHEEKPLSVLAHHTLSHMGNPCLPSLTTRLDSHKLQQYTNNPLQGKITSTLRPQLRSFLRTQLADYMVPSHYVVLESLPLTANGKVDRSALPSPDRVLLGSHQTFVPPQTPIHQRLATLWTELLHTSQIGIHDNFFDLGGHSLLATQLMMHIRTTFQVDLPLRRLFEAPTIAQMAPIIEQLQCELIEQTEETELEQMLSALEELSENE